MCGCSTFTKDNLHAAYVQFDKFAGSYGSDKDLDELVQVAQLDMAAIQLELARSASIDIAKLATAMAAKGSDPVTEGQLIQSQIDLVNAEALAFQTLTLFFQAYPDSPYAQAAGLFLQEVWSFVGTTQ